MIKEKIVPLHLIINGQLINIRMPTTQELITAVLADIQQKGFSSIPPFDIGEVEWRMMHFAETNGIILASDRLYMSAKQLQHCMRASKNAKGLTVSFDEFVHFPQTRFQMDLYFDGECFIYADEQSKFVIHPNYKMKVGRGQLRLVNFITATRRMDKKEFNGQRYIKIETDRNPKVQSVL